MPLVSVIIPTYNRAPVIERAIRSVLSQNFPDFELIVVDDGSADDTHGRLRGYTNHLKLVSQQNRGVSAARNLGIRHATGKLIAFLDSDDEWLPEKLGAQVRLYDPKNPYFICHTNEIWYLNGRVIPQREVHRKQGGLFFPRALERCLISPSSVMLSRALLDQVGLFDEDLPAAEDYDLWLRITAFHAVHFVSDPLVIKHGGLPDQLSMTTPAIDRFRIRAIVKILNEPQLPEDYRRAAVRELVRKCHIVASGCTKKGKDAEAESYFELARSYGHGVSESV